MPIVRIAASLAAALVLTGTNCLAEDQNVLIHPDQWPSQSPPIARDGAMEQKIAGLISRMTLEEKVGQVIQADVSAVTPDDVRELHLGSVLNGGNSAPDNQLRGRPEAWLALADAFWEASVDRSDGGVGIPVIWGTDAVHGSSNIVGATIFPHNIGLGAADDPELLYEIGRATAREITVTGQDWTFAPTLAVVRNDRWGRTYESYSEDPRIVASYAPQMVAGLQGRLGTDEFFEPGRVIACAKHFVGDGGTFEGIDQGDNRATEQQLRDIHAAGYPPAIAAGVQTVMASFNSFHGWKMHAFRPMLNDVLVDRMGFDGFVVGDWNGYAQVQGCSKASCPASFNAGLDMFMAPDHFRELYRNTLEQVRSGVIPLQRLEQAVARILRVKMRAGIFDKPKPSERKFAGDWSQLGAPEHRTLARRAVRESLVLLKNNGGLLPISPQSRVLVAGDAADDIGQQCGGWTLSWQGTGNSNADFPNGESIYEGIRSAVEAGGGVAELSTDGRWKTRPDVAIVVFGEEPYAEGLGDRENVDYAPRDSLELLRRLAEADIPTVSVFLSGRPLWVNPELNASDAFVAAWLPGTEGGGVADVLVASPDGKPRHDFSGRLSFSWPASPVQTEVNVGDADYQPLFAYGYGLDYGDQVTVATFPEDETAEAPPQPSREVLRLGKVVKPWRMFLNDAGGAVELTDSRGRSPDGNVEAEPADDKRQEDTVLVRWNGMGSLVLSGGPLMPKPGDASKLALELRYRVMAAPGGDTRFGFGNAESSFIELGAELANVEGQGWRTSRIPLTCFPGSDPAAQVPAGPIQIASGAGLQLQIASIKLTEVTDQTECGL